MSKVDLKAIEKAEKALHKQIDEENKLDKEIQDIAHHVAMRLMTSPLASMSIQNRDFMVVTRGYLNENDEKCLQIVARERKSIEISTPTIIKADLVIDNRYTNEENMIGGVRALLGHITGYIKPETLD